MPDSRCVLELSSCLPPHSSLGRQLGHPHTAEAGSRLGREAEPCGTVSQPSIIPAHICRTCLARNRPQLFLTLPQTPSCLEAVWGEKKMSGSYCELGDGVTLPELSWPWPHSWA